MADTMNNTGNTFTAISALICARHGVQIPDGVDRGFLVIHGLVDDTGAITARGEAWLSMIEATPLPVQQWIDPRAGALVMRAPDVVAEMLRHPESADVSFVAPSLPRLPDGFTPWGGELGTVFDPNLKTDVKVMVPNGIGLDTNVVLFQRNGKVRTIQGNQRFAAGQVNWAWAKEPADDPMQDATAAKKQRERYERQRAEDVIGYSIIPGEDDHLRRDIKR